MSNSTPRSLENWEDLLQAVQETEDELTGVAPFRDALIGAHTRAAALKSLRDTLQTSTSDARRQTREAMVEGKDAAVALRGFIQSLLGTRNEKLLTYGLQPKGRHCRGRRKKGAGARKGVAAK
jgi:hypothetical protein